MGQLTSTNIEFGRGKDKQKRKRKALLTGVGTIGGASAVGGALGARSYQRKFTRLMYEIYPRNNNPTKTNVDAVTRNFRKYKLGQGSAKADVTKKLFNQVTKEGGVKGAALLGATAAGALGARAIYKKLKNRKAVKIAGKTLYINKPD